MGKMDWVGLENRKEMRKIVETRKKMERRRESGRRTWTHSFSKQKITLFFRGFFGGIGFFPDCDHLAEEWLSKYPGDGGAGLRMDWDNICGDAHRVVSRCHKN